MNATNDEKQVPVEPEWVNDLKRMEAACGVSSEDLEVLRYIDALQAALKRAQDSCDRLTGMKFSDRVHAALLSRAEKAEASNKRMVELLNEPSGVMWSVGRAEFIKRLKEYQRTESGQSANAVADCAGDQIFKAMAAALLKEVNK